MISLGKIFYPVQFPCGTDGLLTFIIGERELMGKQGDKRGAQAPRYGIRHPLLIYRNLGRRYRPPALLLIVLGLFAQLPNWIAELQNEWVSPETLAKVGGVLILAGVGFWLFAMLAERKAYVQCRSDLFVVRSPFRRTLISYRRIQQVRAVPVSDVFDRQRVKGLGKVLLAPLWGMMAVEVRMRSWPTSPKRLRRLHGRHLFTPTGESWVFIVPNYSLLLRDLEEALQRKKHADRRTDSGYLDPIARLERRQR